MKKVIEFLEKYFVPVAGRIGSQRHLVAVRDGFVAIMPLVLAGSFAVLINNLPIQAFQNLMVSVFGEGWKSFGGNVWMGSFAVMSLVIVFSVSYNLAKSYDSNGLAAGLMGFASLMTITQSAADAWAIPYQWTGALGLFVALFVALVSTEIFVRLSNNKKLVIKMPEGVPPAVGRSFAALIPSVITLCVFALIKVLTTAAGMIDIHETIYSVLQAPLQGMANTLPSAMLVAFLVHLLWFFGLHGTNILAPMINAVYLPAIEQNITAFSAGAAIPNIVTAPFFDAFVYMGGAGTTIGLLAAIFIASKRASNRSIAKLATPPALFNINEPILFGMPLVLSAYYAIPFILTPVVLTITSYTAIVIGLVPRTIAIVPWTTPPIIGGFLVTGSVMGSLLQVVNIAIAIAMYLPFIFIAEKMEKKQVQAMQQEEQVGA